MNCPLHPHDDLAATAAIMREIGEWALAGWYEGLALPHPRQFGLAYRRLYENMEVVVDADRLLLPHEPFPNSRDRLNGRSWYANGFMVDMKHHAGLSGNQDFYQRRREQYPQYAPLLDAVWEEVCAKMRTYGGYTHSNPDIRRVVNDGFLAMEAELDKQLAATDLAADEELFLLTVKDYTTGVRSWHGRVVGALNVAADAASGQRAADLAVIADSFADCFMTPSTTFLQGLLAVNFTWLLDGCDSIGRVDQALGPLFEQDMQNGTLDIALVRRLLDELFQAFERVNGWNLQIGGWTPDGRDGCNLLTRELIAACGRNHVRRPNVALRITGDTPDDVLVQAIEVLRDGSGRPALYNDDLYVKTLHGMDLGLTLEDAREIGFGGCTETMIAGLSNCGSLEGQLSFAKCLELALHDGYDPIAGDRVGPHTGAFTEMADFAAFDAAVRRQIQYMTDAFCGRNKQDLKDRMKFADPKPYRSFFTRDCVKNRKSFEAGGARYNWAVVSYQGIANLVDSMAAVRQVVYEQQACTPAELLAALDANFVGCEELRERLRQAPRFGNDIPDVDALGADLMRFAWEELYRHETPRGGRYLASCILFATYGGAGAVVGALPDGRGAREPLTDSVGPAQGRDVHGPTAMLTSVVRLPLHLAVGTPVLNLRFQREVLNKADGLKAVASLVRTFFREGGMQLQLSVLSRAEMLDAQEHPDDHADLIVRIGGYSEYFNLLDRALQDSVIARTEHGI